MSPEKLAMMPDYPDMWDRRRRMVRFLARVGLPIFTVIFVIGYTIYAVYSYANPQLQFE